MKIIVPMAGMGKRLRPHTLTIPKPLVPVVGKPIVQRLVEDIASLVPEQVSEIAFVIGRFGEEVEKNLVEVAESLGAKGSIHYQDEALGTAHAILCAQSALEGNVIVAFADTLFKADFKIDPNIEGVIWTSRVEDPSAFGVVKIGNDKIVEGFVEKPETFVSDQAIIGIYYFKDGENLRKELQYLIDNDVRIKGGEFGLTDALENMRAKGVQFKIDTVTEWWDCGNKEATIHTNQRVLANMNSNQIDGSAKINDSVIIEPCFIGPNVEIGNSVVGPYVSVGANSKIVDSVVKNTIVQTNTDISNSNIKDSMIGNHASVQGKEEVLSIGDHCTIS